MNQTRQFTHQIILTFLIILFVVGCSSSIPTPADPTITGPTTLTATEPTTLTATEPTILTATEPIPPTASAVIQPTVTASTSPTVTATEMTERQVKTGVDELDLIIQIVLEGDIQTLRSLVRYTIAECTFEDGLGGPPKCPEGEVGGGTVEVLPFIGPEGHFIRKEEIDSWSGVNAKNIYAVYSVSATAYSDPIYPSGEYAIAFINEAGFLITTLQIIEGQIVRVDTNLGNPPAIPLEDVEKFLIPPWEISTPEEQGLDPDLETKLYYDASQLETTHAADRAGIRAHR